MIVKQLCEWLGVSFGVFTATLSVAFIGGIAYSITAGEVQFVCGFLMMIPYIYVGTKVEGPYFERLPKLLVAGVINSAFSLMGYGAGFSLKLNGLY